MNRCVRTGLLASLLAAASCRNLEDAPRSGPAAAASPAIEARADAVLRSMGEFLGKKSALTVQAERTEERVRYSGQKIEFAAEVSGALRRPGHLLARQSGPGANLEVAIRPGSITIYGPASRGVARLQGPDTLDEAFDLLVQKHGVTIAMLDLLVSDPYASAKRTMRTGEYVGLEKVGGVPCHHLAFTADGLDWELWVDAGAEPVPRQLKIVYRGSESVPSVCVRGIHWTFPAALPDDRLELSVPVGAKEMTPEELLSTIELGGGS
jgi:hypothetical protein